MKLKQLIEKHPTISSDYIAYTSGASKTYDVAYQDYVNQVETVERAIRLISNVISLCEFKAYKIDSKGGKKPTKIKDMDLLFPNELDTHIDFKRKLASSLFTQGGAIIIAEKNSDKTISDSSTHFYVYSPSSFKIESDGSKIISEFIYTGEDGSETSYRPEEIIYINDSIDPTNLLYSLTRLNALNDVITLQASIIGRTKDAISGGAKDSFIVSASNPIGEKQQQVIKGAFDSFIKSTTSQSLFLNTELSIDKVSSTMTGSEMLEFFTKVNQIILDQFNLPPAMLGDYSASGANKNEELLFSLRVWYTTMLKPIVQNIGLQFTRYFKRYLGAKNLIIELDPSDIDILDDFIDTKVDRAIKLHKSGLMSLNEARLLAELPELDDESANWHFMPQYLTGSAPITFENYDEEVERLLQDTSPEGTPAGNSGDEDNTNVVDDTRGGDAVGDNNEN